MSAKFPTQRVIDRLRAGGHHVDICERRITARLTKDLHGFADVHAFDELTTWLIQVTTRSNHAARRKKINASAAAGVYATGPYRYVEVWSYSATGKLWRERYFGNEEWETIEKE